MFNRRLISRDGELQKFDVIGKMGFHDASGSNPDDTYSFDGDGERAKWIQTGTPGQYYYFLKSTVLGNGILQMDSLEAMFKEYVYSPSGAMKAYLSNNEVFWKHEEPSRKEMYTLKQYRTATSKTFDPNGTEANNVGYNGGHPCPPLTCSSPPNSTILGPKFTKTQKDNKKVDDWLFSCLKWAQEERKK